MTEGTTEKCKHCSGPLACVKCGELHSPPSRYRNIARLQAYHCMIHEAFRQWPEDHEFCPENPEHLRKWLQVSAGFRIYRDWVLSGDKETDMLALQQMMVWGDALGFIRRGKKNDRVVFRVFRSKSIALRNASEAEMRDVFEKVSEVVESVIGYRPHKEMSAFKEDENQNVEGKI